MRQEIEGVIDSLWNLDKDIQRYAYKEPKALNFKFRYGTAGWRDLINLSKQSLAKKWEQKSG
jgi:hypothetical protein